MADAGTVTVTEATSDRSLRKLSFVWTSSAGGAADKQTTRAYSGIVERVVTIPNGSTTQPTDQYDCTLLDDDGADVCLGNAANRSNVNTEQLTPDKLTVVYQSKLYLHVTNGGNAKGGTFIVYLR